MARKPGVPVNKKGEKINKTEFVLKFPGTPASEIIAKAKIEGIELTDRYIYSIRSAARTKGKAPPKAPPAITATGTHAVAATAPLTSAEQALYAVAAQIGLSRAIGLLERQQAVARTILGD